MSSSKSHAIPLAIEKRMRWFVNNQRFADVSFVVGPEKQTVYAHKNMIASGSPVFEQMFFSNHDLQMDGSEPIEIPDLTSTGFYNMLKYIYTNSLEDLALSELYDTFMAGDKYQVYKMNEKMFAFIKEVLNTSNCCIIYDQLMKFPSQYVCVPLDQVKTKIRFNSVEAFKNKHFVNISVDTLVDLLSMDALTIEEIEVLRSCANWVNEEISRLNLKSNASNKQLLFQPIKNLIRFSKITFDQLRNFKPIKDLLSNDELSSLFLHLLDVSPFTVECNSARKELLLRSAYCSRYMNTSTYTYQAQTQHGFSEFSIVFKASDTIILTNVYTFLLNVNDLKFSILNMADGVKFDLNYEMLQSEGDNCAYFRLIDFVKIEAGKSCKFHFKFPLQQIQYNKISRDVGMVVKDKSLECTLSSSGYHCLKKITFY